MTNQAGLSLAEALKSALADAFEAVAGEPTDPILRPSQQADFQANAAMALAKKLGKSPQSVASEVVSNLEVGELCETAEVSGPGFINLIVKDSVISELSSQMVTDARLGVAKVSNRKRVVVDYSSPNAAKEMHVGHLRSSIIGDAVVRVLEWMGHDVIKQNHIGEWGTPFGMLIEHLLDIGEQRAIEELSVGDLDGFYKAARAKFESDETFADRSRKRVIQLQSGDSDTLRLWTTLVEQSKAYFMAVYSQLGVLLTEEDFMGESQYNDQLDDIVSELSGSGQATISEQALCVFPEGFTGRDDGPLPMIVQKSDGGYGYAATDLATIRYRLEDLKADRLVYVVGAPQRQHLEMVYQTAREAGWLNPPATAEHVPFGSILGTDGKMFKSRAGVSVKLTDLLNEAVERADAAIVERNPELAEDERTKLAAEIGIGAIKFADLSTDRIKDYTLDFERMVKFEGDTGPYIQYAHARIHSIFRKAEVDFETFSAPINIVEPAERALALNLLAFGDTISEISETLELHHLATYLFSLASSFTTFYDACPVLKAADAETVNSRLALSKLCASTFAQGLELLGIGAPKRM